MTPYHLASTRLEPPLSLLPSSWQAFPTLSSNNCSSSPDELCEPLPELDSCVCRVHVDDAPVFVSAADIAALAGPKVLAAALASRLPIGAPPPEHYGNGAYSLCATATCAGLGNLVTLYTRGTPEAPLMDQTAIVRVVVNGTRVAHLANRQSVVSLAQGTYTFRNPPSFMSVHELTARDAIYETDALIDHLVYHANTAPFISKALIQFLVTSNPSPRYVASVVAAFKTGQYEGEVFTGQHGDLGAAVTALLLVSAGRGIELIHPPLMSLCSTSPAPPFPPS